MPKRKKPPSLGQQIRAARQARGITQAEVAEALGVSQSRVSEYERGSDNRTPTIVQLATIAKVLRARFSTDGKTTVFEIEE